jgi:uncharacterized membrane protein
MSNELITKETLDTAIKGGESIAKVLSGTATELMNEAIALFIMESILSVLKFAAVFVVFFIVKKYCDTMAEASKAQKDGGRMFHAFKTAALVCSIIFFTASSFPHITQIGKALVAPKIFLIEKANELRK